jgi:hypothetical protein
MKSFGILSTNVGLTTNVKITVDSKDNLFLDSIESNQDLSKDRFKRFQFNSKNYLDELIPYFFKDVPSNLAFSIKYDNDIDTMSNDFSNQYDELYQYGARNILNNKSYDEEFEYFAPLYINKDQLPSKFVIFRVDGPGVGILTKENFTNDIVSKFKFIKLFDLTTQSNLGKWLERNLTKNQYFPHSPLEIDFRELEFCKWNGIDYETGGYTSKSIFIDDIIDEEKEIFELEKFIFEKYKTSKVVFPNILNFSFLFDDEPSTPEIKKKWSINRYYGFYLEDLEKVTTISPYITPFIKPGVTIGDGNILVVPNSSSTNQIDPFLEGWSDKRPFYIEYNGQYYKVEKFKEVLQNQLVSSPGITTLNEPSVYVEDYMDITISKWRIISDIDLKGKESEINKNYGIINSLNKIVDYNNSYITIDGFEDYSVWLIEIDGVYHNLYYDGESIKLITDYSFEFQENDYTYKVSGVNKKVNFVVDDNNPPKKFTIYRAKFSDIKDFDTRIVDTEYSKFEYEKKDSITVTDEPKMYMENLLSTTNPKDLDDFRFSVNSPGSEVINIPVSSEYTANYETFKVEKVSESENSSFELSDIWRKNPIYCRWSFQNSLSANDYPYSLNNSLLFEDFNRTVNPFISDPIRTERNLDYFYTINSSTSSYIHHSLHIEKMDSNGNLDNTFKFELDKYLGLATYSVGSYSATYSFDYFTDFFYQKQYFLNGEISKNVKKYSEFNKGDNSIPNISVFRGLKFEIFDVDSIDINNINEIEKINLSNSNKYQDYKLSILLSDNDQYVDDNGNLSTSNNLMDWSIISQWEMDKFYPAGSIVIFDDILYQALNDVITEEPDKMMLLKRVKTSPHNLVDDWQLYNSAPFWSPNTSYSSGDFVYNNGDYYYMSDTSGTDFWNPITSNSVGYASGSVVLFKGQYWKSTINSNQYTPDNRSIIFHNDTGISISAYKPWVLTQTSNPKWKEVDVWNPTKTYTDSFIYHNNTLWYAGGTPEVGKEPGVDNSWVKKYNLEPDTDYYYPGTNPIIEMNSSYYLCNSNSSNSTLDNGIIIYVNNKWKNILININISDNTLSNISGVDRDVIYTELYKKITASNLSNCINDIASKYGFTDYVTYIIIGEDGKITKHNYRTNLKDIPCLIRVESPDEFSIKINSLTFKPIKKVEKINVSKSLIDGSIKSIDQLNWYNNIPIASEIIENKFEPKVFENYSGNKNFVKNQIFRFSGYYMPTFYDIQLFYKGLDDNSDNGKFDTTLTEFGLIKERKIRKINRTGSILKLRDEQDYKSIYPMIDEFGYTTKDFFIFSSTWDLQYHWESEFINTVKKFNITLPNLSNIEINDFGQPSEIEASNKKFNL